MRRALPLTLALAVVAACAAPPPPGAQLASFPAPPARQMPTAEATGTGAELAFARQILTELQHRSFAGQREYCGYLGLDPQGRLIATPFSPGAEASCPLPRVPPGMTVLASFHTHGAYSPWFASEWPTTQDMATDAADGIDGYISTPGGRLWYVDSDRMTVRLICGPGCLPQDPDYRPEHDGPLRPVMTYGDLLAWERS
jgi:hypothetical protein